jgi:ferredoxin
VPEKYHIHTEPAPPRWRVEGKLGIVDWREDCAGCHNCVKKGCVYNLYRDEADALHGQRSYLDYIYQCKGCLVCVQNCTKNILTRVINPEYERLGDDYFTPDMVLATWFQAETGSIPVSGCGYGGPFSGKGFDSMWTDMSEIVRPTRDGIHGREYINTGVDIGRKLNHLAFEGAALSVQSPPIITTPLPLMFNTIPERWCRGPVLETLVGVAAKLGLFAIVHAADARKLPESVRHAVIPLLDDAGRDDGFANAPMIIVPDRPDVLTRVTTLKDKHPGRIVCIRITASPHAAPRAVELATAGAEVLDLVFDEHGREDVPSAPRHARDVIREVHKSLLKAGVRDEMTLIASRGIALAEHMAKAIICGADLVSIDVPLAVAMECRLCGECVRGEACPILLEEITPEYAAQRVTNLMGAWHSQLLEMMGAMGMREARRVRGDVGRCMFFEDLEQQAFGRIFGKRKAVNPV